MARLKLREGLLGEQHIYPVFELDFEGMLDSTTGIPNAFDVSANHYTGTNNDGKEPMTIDSGTEVELSLQHFRVSSTLLYRFLPVDIPRAKQRYGKLPDAQVGGAICKFNTNIEEHTSYPAAAYGWEEVTEQPTDLGTNYRYLTSYQVDTDGTPSSAYRPQNMVIIGGSWYTSSDHKYYRDAQNMNIHQFYTGVGSCHFSVAKCNSYLYYGGSSPQYYAPVLTAGAPPSFYYSWANLSSAIKTTYGFCNKNNYPLGDKTGLSGKYYHYIDQHGDYYRADDWNNRNWWQFFVHYTLGGRDYYGIAVCTYTTTYSDEDYPLTIEVLAIDSRFWGESVIPGGGGSGQWTNDGVVSHVQGGRGRFDAPSDNHGDRGGTTAESIASTWSGNKSIFDTGYNKYLMSSPDSTAFKQMVDNLVDPDVWQGFDNKYYNPVESIITCAMIPANLAPSGTAIGTSAVIKASKLNLSTTAVPTFSIWNKRYHVGDVDISAYFDGFPDFDNTTITINLPYIGVKALDVAACMDGVIAVDYIIDYLTSDVTAQIWTKDKFGNYEIRYEFKGNCGLNIPLQQIVPRSTAIMQGVGSAVVGLATGLATGGVSAAIGAKLAGNAAAAAYQPTAAAALSKTSGLPAGSSLLAGPAAAMAREVAGLPAQKQAFWGAFGPSAANSMAGGISSISNSAAGASQMLTSSNANGGSVSSPVNTQCYITITRPQWSAPEKYGKLFGYPSDIGGTINQSDTDGGDPFTNFLSVRSIKLEGINCLSAERAEIEELMQAGVYVSNDE